LYTKRLESILIHTRANSSIGTLMKINLGLINLITGKTTPYLVMNQTIDYIPNNRFTGVHKFVSINDIQIKFSDVWRPITEREKDFAIMDLATKEDCSRLSVINNWRLYFQVVLLSDMLNSEGNKVEAVYLTYPKSDDIPTHPHRTSLLNWPIQGKPSFRSFTYWKTYICSIANCDLQGNMRSKLGPWTVQPSMSINRWNYYHSSTNNLLVYNEIRNCFFIAVPNQRKRTSGEYLLTDVEATPDGTFYPTTVYNSNNSYKVTYVQTVSKDAVDKPSTTDFNSYLDTMEPWVQRLLSMWWSVPIEEIKEFLCNSDNIIMVSDGGMITPKGSYGVVIGNQEKAIKATVEGHAKGSPLAITSFRCEAYGMLAGFLFLKHLCKYFDVRGMQRPITYFCDGLALLNRISNDRQRPLQNRDYLKDDIDIELQILDEINQLETLGFKISVNFVRGHQKLNEQSTTEAIFNDVADNMASRNLNRHNSCLPFDLLPTMKVIVEINKLIVTGIVKDVLKDNLLYPPLYTEMQQKFWPKKQVATTIWWEVHQKTLHRFSFNDQQRIKKFNFHLLFTKAMEHKLDHNISAQCPRCNHIKETGCHIIQCPSLQQQRQDMLDNIYKHMQQSIKNNDLNSVIYSAISAYIMNRSIPTLTDICDDPSEYLTEAYNMQSQIGWDHFCRGRMSSLWEPLYNYEQNKATMKQRITAKTWASNIIFDIWNGFLTCWETRNTMLYGQLTFDKKRSIRSNLMKEVNALIQTRLLTCSISDFKGKSIPWIVQWLRHQQGKDSDISNVAGVIFNPIVP
jgi:hypothetical protein